MNNACRFADDHPLDDGRINRNGVAPSAAGAVTAMPAVPDALADNTGCNGDIATANGAVADAVLALLRWSPAVAVLLTADATATVADVAPDVTALTVAGVSRVTAAGVSRVTVGAAGAVSPSLSSSCSVFATRFTPCRLWAAASTSRPPAAAMLPRYAGVVATTARMSQPSGCMSATAA
jgi:hypothetical protein